MQNKQQKKKTRRIDLNRNVVITGCITFAKVKCPFDFVKFVHESV